MLHPDHLHVYEADTDEEVAGQTPNEPTERFITSVRDGLDLLFRLRDGNAVCWETEMRLGCLRPAVAVWQGRTSWVEVLQIGSQHHATLTMDIELCMAPEGSDDAEQFMTVQAGIVSGYRILEYLRSLPAPEFDSIIARCLAGRSWVPLASDINTSGRYATQFFTPSQGSNDALHAHLG